MKYLNKLNKKTYLVTGIISLFILIVGLTFAFFTWNSEDKTYVNIGIEHVEVIYNGGTDITGVNLIPTSTKNEGILKEMTIRVDRDDLEPKPLVTITLVPEILPEGLRQESFKYTLLKNDVEVASGNFQNAIEQEEILLTNQIITTLEDNYKLYIWIDGNMDNPNEMTNQEFKFILKVGGLHALYNPIATSIEAKNERNIIKTGTTTKLEEYFNIGETYNGSTSCYIDNTEYETPKELNDGEYEVSCIVENGYGIETSANTILIIDGTVPNVTAIESTSYVNLDDTKDPEDLFNFSTLGISGGSRSCSVGGNVVTDLSTLNDGSYTLTCSLASGVGDISSDSTTLILDRTTPVISAKNTKYTYAQGVSVIPTTLFNVSSYGTSGGNTVCRTGSTVVSNISTLQTGTYTLTCTMTTGTGKSASASTSLVVDGTTPTISAKAAQYKFVPGTSAVPTSYFNVSSYGISGGTTTCKVGSTTITNVSTLAHGTYTLTCTMTTGAGKTASASTSLIVDGTTPTISAKATSNTINPGTSAAPTSYFNVSSYGISGGTTTCKVGTATITNVSSLGVGTHTLTCTMTTGVGKTASASTTIIVKEPNSETSGASAPMLHEGLIPVKWSGSTVVKANADNPSSNKWYDYTNKQWANAVMVTSSTRSTYMNAAVGSTINTSDILAYWVWIPRYRYKLFNATFTTFTSPQTIEIVFESPSTTKSTGSTNETYLTHPAFTFGSTELSGIWVAKFEPSGSATAGSLKVLPGVSSLSNNMSISQQYSASQLFMNSAYLTTNGISTVDSHMMKNIEWGAIAYLSHSKYGKNAEITINNTTYYTGGGTGTAYITNVDQSTTGTVYGVYDMSGGAHDFVMGNYNNVTGSSGLTVTSINKKYVDVYTGGTLASSKLGDAVGETWNWYYDFGSFVNSTYPWFFRGAGPSNGLNAGIFATKTDGGGGYAVGATFRPVLTAK